MGCAVKNPVISLSCHKMEPYYVRPHITVKKLVRFILPYRYLAALLFSTWLLQQVASILCFACSFLNHLLFTVSSDFWSNLKQEILSFAKSVTLPILRYIYPCTVIDYRGIRITELRNTNSCTSVCCTGSTRPGLWIRLIIYSTVFRASSS